MAIKALFASLLSVAALLFAAAPGVALARAESADYMLGVDQARILKLDRPATTIVIGNASIADATVRSGTMLVMTGKSFGVTNLIALDDNGDEIIRLNLNVTSPEKKVLSLYRGTERRSYSCAPRCERTLMVGDNKIEMVDDLVQQLKAKTDITMGNETAVAPPAQQ